MIPICALQSVFQCDASESASGLRQWSRTALGASLCQAGFASDAATGRHLGKAGGLEYVRKDSQAISGLWSDDYYA